MELFGDEFEICPHCGYVVGTHAEEAIHIEPGTLLYDRYIVGKVLGYGGFGVTYLGWDGKLEQKVAIKEYLPGEFSTRMPGQSQVTVFNGEKNEQFHDGLKKFVEEAKHLAKFQNEQGIVKIFDSFEENDTAYIIMEYLDGETLTDYLRREKTIPEDVAVAILMPVMESLQAVHDAGLLHRDIAPDNIFLTKSGEVKLIDFGASR
jgi:serine/threonine protein kinase